MTVRDRIRVYVKVGPQDQPREARIATNVPVRDLLPSMIVAFRLSSTDVNGHAVVYELMEGDRQLSPDQTLHELEIVEGATIALVPRPATSLASFRELLHRNSIQTSSLKLSKVIQSIKDLPPDLLSFGYLPFETKTWTSTETEIPRIIDSFAQEYRDVDQGWPSRLHGRMLAIEREVARLASLIEQRIPLRMAPGPPESPPGGTTPTAFDSERDSGVQIIRPTVFEVSLDKPDRLAFAVMGAINFKSNGSVEFGLDPDDLIQSGMRLGYDWQNCTADAVSRSACVERSQGEGRKLHRELFEVHADLSRRFGAACQAAREDENVKLSFVGPHHYVGIPWELLRDSQNRPLATRHAISHAVTDIEVAEQVEFGDFLAFLRRQDQPLRALVLGGCGEDPAAIDELNLLGQQMKRQLLELHVPHEVEIKTDCTHKGAREVLRKCKFHLVHCVGNCPASTSGSKKKGIRVGDTATQGQEHAPVITLGELEDWLRQSETILFFVSGDRGAALSEDQRSRNDSCLGVVDALVRAGVPNVLGFRWAVSRRFATQFALAFYQALFETKSPARAVLAARRQAYLDNEFDETWLSSVLVAQKP